MDADGVIVAQVARLELLAPEERLDPEKLMREIGASGKPTAYLPDADATRTNFTTRFYRIIEN